MFIEPTQPLLGGMASLSGSRRSRGLTDIIPQYGATKPGNVCSEGEIRSVGGGGSVRIHHLTGVSPDGRSRFPKLEECAHFHYEHVELGPLQISLCDDEDLKPIENEGETKSLTVRVTSAGQSWLLRRTYDNFRMLDQQLHRCIYDRKFSNLTELPDTPDESQESLEKVLSAYLVRLSAIAGSLMNCGPVLSWLELDNRGRRLLVTEGDSCPINTPAVAAAYSIKKYTAVAADEISFDIGDMISVIDMPPPEESAWWRGKRGFLVGFFPSHCVAVITDKLPRNLNLHQSLTLAGPTKPVLRKHGKLIAFFRAFILSRPSRRRLKQSGILKERVFGCDLGEHLLNSGHEIPMVLKCCAEFIESHGIVDGIYRLSGVTSNIQKLRRTFDEDRVPALYDDEAILQDIHSVASLLKMYFRELPNPLCTYQLYEGFVNAVQADKETDDRLLRMRETVEKLPPPHYRTLEYLMRHLARVSEKGNQTGMTARNIAIVWAPNLLRCKELEVGGVAALQGVGVQAVVTEFLIVYADLIFCSAPLPVVSSSSHVTPKKTRPKSLAISTPTKLLSLEEAQSRALASGKPEQDYIEVGGGPSCLPAKYHTIIELPRKRPGSKRSPLGWKSLFTKASRHGSVGTRKSRSPAATSADQRKSSVPSDIVFGHEKALTESDLTSGRRRLRPVKSAESLASAGQTSARSSGCLEPPSPPSPQVRPVQPPGHNRSVSHDSYFDTLTETPQHGQEKTSSQLLQEEDEEGLSLSLDLSELQVNFDLEESEMRIFSEDETNHLFSSHNSLENNQVCKRQPLLARAEDSSSADPSPKKHKTGNTICTVNNRSKRSRLEERLSSSAELRYIDSGSPDQHVQIHVEVHSSPSRSHSPSLAEATVSENESLTLSGLTTPDTPTPRLRYTPLTEDSLSDAVTTPEYHKLSSSPFPSPSNNFHVSGYENLPRDRLSYPGETLGTRYENIPRDRLSFQGILRNGDVGLCEKQYENHVRELSITNEVVQYENLSNQQFVNLGNDLNGVDAIICDMKVDDVKYEEIKESSIYESVDDVKKTTNFYENVSPQLDDELELYEPVVRKELDCSYEEISGRECLLSDRIQKEGISSSGSLISPLDVNCSKENEYECLVALDSSPDDSKHVPDSNQNLCSPEAINPEEHFYEDIQTASLPDSIVYQQVKYLRRSVHEINQLLEESMEPFTGEDVSSLEEEETALISPMNNNGTHDVAANGVEPKSDSIFVSSDKPVSSVFSVSVDQTLSVSLSKKFEEAQLKSSESAGAPTVQSESVTSVSPSQILDSNNDLLVSGIETDKDLCENSTMDDVEAISSSFEEQGKCVEMLCDDSKSGSGVDTERKSSEAKTSLRQSITNTNKSQKDNVVVDSKISNKENTEPSRESQTRKLIQNLDENRRKFESEIGRDIVRERKMRQELEANSSSTGNSTSGKNVQELMSRFEWSHSEKESVPPCLKARLNRQNSKDKTPNLTTSLDGSSFPCEASQLPRVKTSPDLNQNQEELMKTVKPIGELIDSEAIRRERIEKYKEERRTFLRKKYRTDSFNNNDDKDEEMIRRLKAKTINNRTSESSDTVEENALNASHHLSESSEAMEWTRRSPTRKREVSESNSYTESGEKETENRFSKSKSDDVKPVKRSPSKTTVSISYSPTKSKAASWENSLKRNSKTSEIDRISDSCKNRNVCAPSRPDKSDHVHEVVSTKSDAKHNRPDDLNLSGIPSRRKEEIKSPNVSTKADRRLWRGFEAQNRENAVDKSPDESLVARRVNQLSASSDTVRNDGDRVSIQRRTSLTDSIKPNSSGRQRANSSSARSPSYCIRDMAAMFENRDIK